jgi:glycosyltransferase involved in cell wall biosynthesis
MPRNLMIIAGVPAFNEEATVANVVFQAKAHVSSVIVIDDGSSDRTSEIARLAGAVVVRHKSNEGYGGALKTCFAMARKLHADAMVILDSDGQHDPEEIPIVLAPVTSGKADIVIGSRFIGKYQNSVPPSRRIGIMLLNFVTSLLGPNVLDSQSGFRAFSARAISLIDPSESGMGAGSEILIQACEKGLKIVEVPTHCSYESRVPLSTTFTRGLEVLLSLVRQMLIRRH